jgi:hypothetical protein
MAFLTNLKVKDVQSLKSTAHNAKNMNRPIIFLQKKLLYYFIMMHINVACIMTKDAGLDR